MSCTVSPNLQLQGAPPPSAPELQKFGPIHRYPPCKCRSTTSGNAKRERNQPVHVAGHRSTRSSNKVRMSAPKKMARQQEQHQRAFVAQATVQTPPLINIRVRVTRVEARWRCWNERTLSHAQWGWPRRYKLICDPNNQNKSENKSESKTSFFLGGFFMMSNPLKVPTKNSTLISY